MNTLFHPPYFITDVKGKLSMEKLVKSNKSDSYMYKKNIHTFWQLHG